MAHVCAVNGMKQEKSKYKLKKGVSEKIIRDETGPPGNAQELTNEEFFGERSSSSGLNNSEEEEGAGEGQGDGNIGRSVRNPEE
jgi:hypothetical protein